jgi:adenylate kinase
MRLVLLGAPGAGKGTQASLIKEHFKIPEISTGHMLRQAIADKTPIGLEVQALIESGSLVSDEIMIKLMANRLEAPDCQRGFLLDGFPRTLAQAQALSKSGILIDFVIELTVSESVLIKRLTGRWVHLASGRTYHAVDRPPKKAGHDDVTGEPLAQRSDDTLETVKHRLDVYHELTEAVGTYYKQLALDKVPGSPRYFKINGEDDPASLFGTIVSILEDKPLV